MKPSGKKSRFVVLYFDCSNFSRREVDNSQGRTMRLTTMQRVWKSYKSEVELAAIRESEASYHRSNSPQSKNSANSISSTMRVIGARVTSKPLSLQHWMQHSKYRIIQRSTRCVGGEGETVLGIQRSCRPNPRREARCSRAGCELLARFPDAHDGYDRLGMVYEARGDKRHQAECYRKAIEVNQQHPDDFESTSRRPSPNSSNGSTPPAKHGRSVRAAAHKATTT